MSDELPKPGPETGLDKRPLHFFFLVDCSGSMEIAGKIHSLNEAIRNALPHMRKAAAGQPEAQMLVRAIKFSSGAQWHTPRPTPVAEFNWTDLTAGGPTDMGKALQMLADELKPAPAGPMPQRALPPVLVLLTDGEPTDDFGSGLKVLMDQPWGRKAVRLGIAIGQDANLEVLQRFIGSAGGELKPLQANNPEALVHYIKWASTQVVNAVASPASQTDRMPAAGANVDITPPPEPPPPSDPQAVTVGDVW